MDEQWFSLSSYCPALLTDACWLPPQAMPEDHLSVRFTWLNTFADGTVCGIQQSAKIPVQLIQHVLTTRKPVKYLYHEPVAQARIDSSRAGETIRQILTSPQKRRALCKAMRDSFHWVDETVSLFNDFGDSFYFTTESGFPSNGGLVLFENTYDGHKGLCYQVCTWDVDAVSSTSIAGGQGIRDRSNLMVRNAAAGRSASIF
jgi:hypothetical protein